MQRFSVAHAAKKVDTYIHPFFQGIIKKKNKHIKITPEKEDKEVYLILRGIKIFININYD